MLNLHHDSLVNPGNSYFKMCVIPYRSRKWKVGTLNVRGIQGKYDQSMLADVMNCYDLNILGIQETHLKDTGIFEIQTSNGKKKYDVYDVGDKENKHHGAGIVINKDLNA